VTSRKGGPPGAFCAADSASGERRLCLPPGPRWSPRQSRVAQPLLALLLAGVAACSGPRSAGRGQASNPIAPVALPKANPQAQSEFEEGVVVMKLGRKHYKEARKHFTKATQLDDKLFEAWHDLGVVETAMGNYDKAVEHFEKALDVQPGSRKTILAYGESLRRAHRPQKAAKVYAKWLDSDPNDAEMRSRYGQVLREAGDLEESLEQARQLLAMGGSSGENVARTVIAYNALGLTYYKMGKLDLADTAFRKAADLDAKSAFVWNNLGLVAFDRGHDQEAFLNFQKASDLDPKYVQARLNKAVVYLDCGDYKRARAELEEAVKIDPNDADAQVALGVAARGDGKLDQARRAYERALDIEDEYAPALFNLAVLYMDYDKDKTKAKDFLTRYTQSGDATDAKIKEAQARLKELQ
jgi:tetratricopeptide (TPR) repeat protein